MKCPICGKDVELQKKQAGVDELGEPVFNQYAICRDCKKQWNLDKQRAKKAAAQTKQDAVPMKEKKADNPSGSSVGSAETKGTGKPVAKKVNTERSGKAAAKRANGEETGKPAAKKVNAESTGKSDAKRANGEGTGRPTVKRVNAEGTGRPAAKRVNGEGSERPAAKRGNGEGSGRPAAKRTGTEKAGKSVSRAASEAAPVRKNASVKKARPEGVQSKSRTASAEATDSKDITRKVVDITEEQRYGNIPSEKVRAKKERAVKKGYEEMLSTDPKHTAEKAKKASSVKEKPEPEEIDEYDDMEEPMPKFRVIRVILGILSIFAFAYFIYRGLLAGLDNIAAGNSGIGGIAYIVLALCMLVAGLLLLILQRKNTIFAFILPMIFYLGSAVYAFLMRDGDSMLLYGAIAGAVLAVIFLILTIASRGQDEEEYDDYDDYDDPFEDDFE